MKARGSSDGFAVAGDPMPRADESADEALQQCPECGGEFPAGTTACPRDREALQPSVPDPLRGVVLGDAYRVLRRIAVGGMGRVYEAEHVRLPRRFAVKVIHEAQAHRTEAVERFEREATHTSRLRSEHVVDVADLLRTPDGRPCIVAEYLEGETLQERLDRIGLMDVDRAVAIAIEICRGLAVAHGHGVVHRDLKPSNVFLVHGAGGREVAKLVDFGVAKVNDRRNLTQTGAFVGTPAYMAPEQAAGAQDLDHRADVYATGAVLYHMISGEPPYGREDPANTLMKLLRDEPPRVRAVASAVPPGLEAIIEQAMAREPASRHANIETLCAELVAFARVRKGEPSAGGEAQPTDRRARWLRPSTLGLIAAAGLLVAGWTAAFGGSLLFWLLDPDALGERLRMVLPFAPALVGAVVIAVGLRRVIAGWRSAPRIQRIAKATRHALAWGLGMLALLEIALFAWLSWKLDGTSAGHVEQAIAFGASGLTGAIAFAIAYARRKSPSTRRS